MPITITIIIGGGKKLLRIITFFSLGISKANAISEFSLTFSSVINALKYHHQLSIYVFNKQNKITNGENDENELFNPEFSKYKINPFENRVLLFRIHQALANFDSFTFNFLDWFFYQTSFIIRKSTISIKKYLSPVINNLYKRHLQNIFWERKNLKKKKEKKKLKEKEKKKLKEIKLKKN